MLNKIKNIKFLKEIKNKIFYYFKGAKRYKNLYSNIRLIKPVNIMEVGTWSGDRAFKMITLAKSFNNQVTYYGFDLFESMDEDFYAEEISKWPPKESEVFSKLNETGAEINLFKGNTMETMPAICPTLPKMDFVYIDGGHKLETVQNDWDCVSTLMHEGTVVIFDDYWPERGEFGGAKLIVDSLDQEKYLVEILKPLDVFDNKDFGTLKINFAKVTLR